MTSPHPTPVITLSDEPSYSAQEAAAMLGRSFSWLDQRLRSGQFVRPDGAVLVPMRAPGGYRWFSLTMLKDIAESCCLKGWFSVDKLRSVYREIVIAAHPGEFVIDKRCPGFPRSRRVGSGPTTRR